jgi:uncharacterized DUF497 family protein
VVQFGVCDDAQGRQVGGGYGYFQKCMFQFSAVQNDELHELVQGLSGLTITREDARDAYGELRLQTLGLWNGIVVFVVHTARGNADQVISIRKVEKHEERIYWKNFPN